MRKFWIVLIVVLAAFAVHSWYVHFAIGTTSSGTGSNTSKSIAKSGTERMRSYSDFAIVSVPSGFWKTRLQDEAARQIQSAIEKADVSLVPDKDGKGWKHVQPKVNIYHSRDEALKHKPELVIEVKAEEWHYVPLPMYAEWKSDVLVEGTPPSYWKDRALSSEGKTLAYSFSVRVMPEARFVGVYSFFHPVHEIASDVAERTAKTMREIVEEELGKSPDDSKSAHT